MAHGQYARDRTAHVGASTFWRSGAAFGCILLAGALITALSPVAGATGQRVSGHGARVLRVGSASYPTLESALAAVPALRRTPGAITIKLPSGMLRINNAITLDAAHGGTASAPLIIEGAAGDTLPTRISGAVPLRQVALPTPLRTMVPPGTIALDLAPLPGPAQPVRRGSAVSAPSSGIALFQGGERLTLSRWPAQSYVAAQTSGSNAAPIVTPGSRDPRCGADNGPLWVGGRFGADWAYEFAPVARRGNAGQLLLEPLRTPLPLKAQTDLFVANALCDLKAPGTYVLRPERMIALVLPFPHGAFEGAVAETLLRIDGASNVTVRNIAFERSRGPAIDVAGGHDIDFTDIAVRQIGSTGIVANGTGIRFERTVISETGERGLLLTGGHRTLLSPSNNSFSDGIVTRFGLESPAYRPGIELSGVGNRISGSLITHGRHNAVMVSGNDNVVTGNEIADVLSEADDVGAIYLGLDWTQRGNAILGNYIHDLDGGQKAFSFRSGVYLDDQISGTTVDGNVIVSGTQGVVIGGGSDNSVTRNIVIGTRQGGILVDARGRNMTAAQRNALTTRLRAMPVTGDVWRQHYPALAAASLDDLALGTGNRVAGNRVFGVRAIYAVPASVAAQINASDNPPAPARNADVAGIRRIIAALKMPSLADRQSALASLMIRTRVPD